jgi:XTP/dITP diphosphohydrolase
MTEAGHRVVVATGNPGKVEEIEAALESTGWEFVTAAALGVDVPAVEETGETFQENALIKSRAFLAATGEASLADDSGLEVDALDGRPGVRSSRFAGEEATDEQNNELLLEKLEGVTDEQRTARFRCIVTLVEPDGTVITADGSCEGRIARAPRGTGGFGYDPLFLPDAAPGRTMAELGVDEKNALSHRGAALRALAARLEASRTAD